MPYNNDCSFYSTCPEGISQTLDGKMPVSAQVRSFSQFPPIEQVTASDWGQCIHLCSETWKWKLLSHVRLSTSPRTIQSMEFSRPEYWSGWPFSYPGDLPNPGIEPRSPALQVDSLAAEPKGKPRILEWVAYPFSSGSSWPRNQTHISCIAGGFFTNWATRFRKLEVLVISFLPHNSKNYLSMHQH